MTIQKADPDLRRKVLFVLAGVAVVGLVAIQWGLPKLMEAIANQEPATAIQLLQVLVVATFAPALPMAYLAYKVARRVKSSQRFPPPGMAVIRDTQVLTGEAAKRLARKLMAISLNLVSVALCGIAYLPYVIAQVGLG